MAEGNLPAILHFSLSSPVSTVPDKPPLGVLLAVLIPREPGADLLSSWKVTVGQRGQAPEAQESQGGESEFMPHSTDSDADPS